MMSPQGAGQEPAHCYLEYPGIWGFDENMELLDGGQS